MILSTGQDSFSGWPCLSIDGTTLLSAAISIWETQNHPWQKATKTDILESLQKLFVPTFDMRVPKQVQILCSHMETSTQQNCF